MQLNFYGFEIQKWNIPSERAQRVDEKNEVICLFIMFTPRIMAIKMSKMAYFCVFWWQKKKSVTAPSKKIFLLASKIAFHKWWKKLFISS